MVRAHDRSRAAHHSSGVPLPLQPIPPEGHSFHLLVPSPPMLLVTAQITTPANSPLLSSCLIPPLVLLASLPGVKHSRRSIEFLDL